MRSPTPWPVAPSEDLPSADTRWVEQPVLEITAGLARLRPDDPARYDFALTRPGILEGHTTEPGSR